VELLAHDLYLLLQKLEIDSTFLLGFSMGGVVAQKFALDYPQKTRGLIILGSSSECNAAAAAWYQERASLAEERGMEAVVEGDTERCFTSAFKMNQPTIVAEYQRMRAQTDPRGYARVARAMASLYQHPLTPELGRITCPTLILVGEEDIACPPGASVIMHRRIPGSQLRIIKGWPHQVLIEAPQELNTAVLEFLAAVSQKRA
jgi:pimeloyl-ACP methyl ester carboxylesterase